MEDKILACWICGKAVDLKICKTDEHGLAVHEACYVMRIILKSQPPESHAPNRAQSKP
jgi:hypothetical protein